MISTLYHKAKNENEKISWKQNSSHALILGQQNHEIV